MAKVLILSRNALALQRDKASVTTRAGVRSRTFLPLGAEAPGRSHQAAAEARSSTGPPRNLYETKQDRRAFWVAAFRKLVGRLPPQTP